MDRSDGAKLNASSPVLSLGVWVSQADRKKSLFNGVYADRSIMTLLALSY